LKSSTSVLNFFCEKELKPDKLIGTLIEPYCQQPTFLMHHPTVMCPLAKPHRDNLHVPERFELFIGGVEITNGYTELNDPQMQRQRFEDQLAAREAGDKEASGSIDTDYLMALECGLPPTSGCGMVVLRSIGDDVDTSI
jgi:lysyl-tRNA synthetase class 2